MTPRYPPLILPMGRALMFERHLLIGILNVTPDSFSDGGAYLDVDRALARALLMATEGADLLDLGAESTRPGAQAVPPEVQIQRLLPVVIALRADSRLDTLPLSIDTRSSAVLAACLDAGADLLNDVSAMSHDAGMASVVAERGCGVVLMHAQGTPVTMQRAPRYQDVVGDIHAFFEERLAAAEQAGVARDRIILDPGFGFGKTLEHNLALLRGLEGFLDLGRPLLVGVSRKRMLGELSGETDPARRLPETLAANLYAVRRGAALLRVHDVGPHVRALRVQAALKA
jgi:dihydropteroate synthase